MFTFHVYRKVLSYVLVYCTAAFQSLDAALSEGHSVSIYMAFDVLLPLFVACSAVCATLAHFISFESCKG